MSCNLSGHAVAAIGGVAGTLPCALIGVLTGIPINHIFDKIDGPILLGVGGAVLSAVYMIIQHLESRTLSHASRIGDSILNVFGRAAGIEEAEAKDLSAWAEACPRIRDICIKWGASNKDMMLHKRDYNQIFLARDKIEKAESKMRASAKKNEAINAAFEKNGLMDAIKAHGTHGQLSSDTTGATGQAKPRRV